MQESPLPRPLPAIDADNKAYWTGGAKGELLIHRCGDCLHYIHPPVRFCPACESRNVAPRPVSGRGTIRTFTINHKVWIAGLPDAYVVALVALDEQADVLIPCNIVGCAPEEVRFDMPVKVVFEQAEDLWIPLFTPAES